MKIDAQAAKSRLTDYLVPIYGWSAARRAYDAIDDVVNGKSDEIIEYGIWEHLRPQSSYKYRCSRCGEIAYCVTGNCGRKVKLENPSCPYKFCPFCGAAMKNGLDKNEKK